MGNVTKTIYNTSMYWLSDDRVYLRTQGEQAIKSCTLIVDSSGCYGNRSWRPSNSVLICFPGWPTGHDQRNNKQQTTNSQQQQQQQQQQPTNTKQQQTAVTSNYVDPGFNLLKVNPMKGFLSNTEQHLLKSSTFIFSAFAVRGCSWCAF